MVARYPPEGRTVIVNMMHKRLISISLAALMLVSLCAVCAMTTVTAKDSSGAPATGLDSGTAVSSWGAGRLDVFAKGVDNNLWHTWYIGGGDWHNWESLGAPPGGLTSAPSAVSWGAGRIDIFARGNNFALWQLYYAAGWYGWYNLGGMGGGSILV
jgi:hypothetical protein